MDGPQVISARHSSKIKKFADVICASFLGADRHRRRRLLIRIPWLFAVDHQTPAGTLLAMLPDQSSIGERGAGAIRLVGHVVTVLLAPKMYLIRKSPFKYRVVHLLR